VLNCGAIAEGVIENDLFGHERGAFTHAQGRSLGLFESARGGTVFLDELNNLPLPQQPKLLRVLQERAIRRAGGTQEIPLDVRVVAASSVGLHEQVESGLFRRDLYHRINVARIELPPPRNRQEDIPLLVGHFCACSAREMGRKRKRVSENY
jgi:transcriptional regulator with GAF, ATPase, and Fis domain